MVEKIQFTVANHTSPTGEKELVPRLKSGAVEEFMKRYGNQRQGFTSGTMIGALYTMRDALVEMMIGGASVHVPTLGTFTLSLGGKVEVSGGKYVGSGVHVEGIRFAPDEELLSALRRLEVDQTPLPVRPFVDAADLDAALPPSSPRTSTSRAATSPMPSAASSLPTVSATSSPTSSSPAVCFARVAATRPGIERPFPAFHRMTIRQLIDDDLRP